MILARWTKLWLSVAVTAGSIAAAARAADDTGRFNGTWIATFAFNGQPVTMVSVHDTSGYKNYVITPEGRADVGDGKFSAADGKWTSSAAAPNDSGTYQFIDANTVFCKNALGQALLWQRDNAPMPPVIGAAANTLPQGTNFAAVKASQAIDVARKMAYAWHADAMLISARVFAPSNDGTVNLLVNPSAFTMYFYSPSTTSGLAIVSAAPVGTFYGTNPPATSPGTIFRPISPQALDLTDAVAAVRQVGFNGGMSQAEMYFCQENGKPIRLIWALFTGEPYPRVVSAASGAVLSPFVAFDDKVADYNQLAAETQAAIARMRGSRRPAPERFCLGRNALLVRQRAVRRRRRGRFAAGIFGKLLRG